ncbi:MAG: ABC transporter ATP-binding protein [Hyphomonadaceae bacterium]|nr:ABC transporter ATP-binding protein [Hyphomonadaceae bacterium]MBC6411570.1 ABC transporter ATP-binding protein [Hyphomonadaceae bacterium]
MIRAKGLTAGYGPCDVLTGISVSADAGQFIALVGPNGSGKSTLIKTLGGLLAHRSGQIRVNDKPLRDLGLRNRARTIAYLAQDRDSQPAMTGQEIITLGRAPYRGHLGHIGKTGQAAINRAVDITKSQAFLKRKFGTLSGGERARVLLARALAVDAPVLLADEPIAALDPYYQITMMEILKAEARSGRLVIAALHDLALVSQFTDHVWVMNRGKIIAEGSPDAVLNVQTLHDVFRIVRPESGFQTLSVSGTHVRDGCTF